MTGPYLNENENEAFKKKDLFETNLSGQKLCTSTPAKNI